MTQELLKYRNSIERQFFFFSISHPKLSYSSVNSPLLPPKSSVFLSLTLSLCFFFYRKTLQLSRQLRDQVMEAQACYSLGNTYTLLQQYERAIDYHLKHLYIAQELTDR